MAAQLYRLNQRLAILNGFDPKDPLQQEFTHEIYYAALGFDAATQTLLKNQMLKAAQIAGKKGSKSNIVLKLIIDVATRLGAKNMTATAAARYIPFVGGAAGAGLNYIFSKKASQIMHTRYKDEFFNRWQVEQR